MSETAPGERSAITRLPEQYYFGNEVRPVWVEPPPTLSFKRALWIIGTAIFVSQIYSLVLVIAYGFDFENYPASFHYYSDAGSVIWYMIAVAIVGLDIGHRKLSIWDLMNLDTAILRKSLPTVGKYFAGCAAAVLLLSLIMPEGELGLKNMQPSLVFLSFFVVVVMAPVCEEIMFRSYLYTAMIPVFKREKERLIVNAMLFAAVHVFFAAFLLGATVPYYIFIIGYLLARLYEKTRSILPCILLHALNNGLAFATEYFEFGTKFGLHG